MIFHKTPLEGAYTIELEKRGDERGFFARYFCEHEFAAEGLETKYVQINNSLSKQKGTLRGLHYQLPPAAEVKLIRCLRGSVWDVIVDLRPQSTTYKSWFAAELTSENRIMMYVPRGFAHAILTLCDDTEVLYLDSAFYSPDDERGIRWDDPCLDIKWPIAPVEVSSKDENWPNLNFKYHGLELLRNLQ